MSEARQRAKQTTTAAAVIVACLPNGQLRVRTDDGAVLTAHVGGDLRRAMPNLVPGDQVCIEAAPLDPRRAMIVRRAVGVAGHGRSSRSMAVEPATQHPNQGDPS
jgi:translation initiation factor IF-1